MGFLEDLWDGIKDMIEEAPDFFSDMKECGDELHEILTDGVKEIIVKGNLDWETSREIREKATSKVGVAKQVHKEKSEQVQKLISDTQQRIDARYQREVKLIEALASSQYRPPNIDQRISDIENYAPKVQLDNFDKVANAIFNSIFGHAISRKEAEDALYNAEQYENFINQKMVELNIVEENLTHLNALLDEEDSLLDSIEAALNKNGSFAHAVIRDQLINLLSTQIYDNQMNITSGYQICISNIKSLCAHL